MSISPDYKTELQNVIAELTKVNSEISDKNHKSPAMLVTLYRRRKKLNERKRELEILSK